MKTLELKLKKYVLIVDLPEDYVSEFSEEKVINALIDSQIYIHSKLGDTIEFLCKGSGLTEEIASELVDKSSFVEDRWYHLAKRGFKANVESKGFHWLVNPIPTPEIQGGYAEDGSFIGGYDDNWIKEWQEAEAKTFKNPLIFVKK